MGYDAYTLKMQYQKNCKKQRIENLLRLREEVAGLSATEFCKQTGIQKSNLSSLECGDRDLSLFIIQAYKTYFSEKYNLDISTDYLLGYTSVMKNEKLSVSDDLGLTGKSIEVLKSWKKLKENPERFAISYGITDIDTLNLLLEDYYDLQNNANKNSSFAGFSVFHYIGNYFFSESFKKCPNNIVEFEHEADDAGYIKHNLNTGDTVKVNETEYVIKALYTRDRCLNISTSDNLSIYNTKNEKEIYSGISFKKLLEAHFKENIMIIIDRIKKRIKGSDE